MNKENYPLISIVIATFNSERLLPNTLKSIRAQSYPQNKIEILIMDGGSTDKTKEIAIKYKCTIIHNPKTVPAWAKYLAYLKAKGNYGIYIDSDEVIENKDSIKHKLKIFLENPKVHGVTGSGYRNPKGYPFLNNYVNEFGDPFSYFIYKLSKDHRFFVKSMKNYYPVEKETNDYVLFNFKNVKKLPIFELVAMSSMVDFKFLKKEFPQIKSNPGLVPHFFNLIISKDGLIGITKKDVLTHYSSENIKKYLGKIRSRVKNNIYTKAEEGFLGRDTYQTTLGRLKKYLFLPYALTLILPLFDSIYLSITRKHFGYFLHVPLSFYTAICILYYYFLKLIGSTPELKSYGESKVVKA
ncbi:glycosyl transferase [candidate division WWE3 bacterium CG10_big_fil_rev_8_21_14_0_10_32_10]|uniref:Glycosyl transferase n=1 Tax=candidate division WWE3 bacterium CG10_big_fil_rev_8_21_14_0_10_32_10 TaxID=1975090 RepID=A0A2H0RAW5_UNCKA|nr:MAG: glycosyl transferase [candidate division WWE3 bacterium CG10_big_fil_rev_8_21_14_0_10_32_10]